MKRELLSYKGYHGTVEFSLKDKTLYGQVIDVNSLISYEGQNLTELEADFHEAVNDYLTMCQKHGETPEKAYSHNESLNASIKTAISQMLTNN